MAAKILEGRAGNGHPPADDVTPPTSAARSSSTLDLQPGDIIHVADVIHIAAGPAVVRSVSERPAPAGGHYVTTDRGTFLAAVDQQHLVLGPELPVHSWGGEGRPASAVGTAAKVDRSEATFATAAAELGHDTASTAGAHLARQDHRVWDLVDGLRRVEEHAARMEAECKNPPCQHAAGMRLALDDIRSLAEVSR